MSVINKMLQDLDARQNGAAEVTHLYTKPAASGERGVPPWLVAGVAVGAVVVACSSAFGWRYWQKAHKPVAPAPLAPKVVIMPAPPRPAPVPAEPAPVVKAVEEGSTAAVTVAATAEPAPVMTHVTHKHASEKRNADKKHAKREAKTASSDRNARPVETPGVQGKEETAAQKAESAYRRGVGDIQDGYLNDGIAALEQALQANPRHDAARQTLVRVLIDNKRTDEATHVLQAGLALDPRQPAMAMLLARLQIEHGGSGIDALMLTLPYAGNNSEYHAFLAGALQRQQRHREAVEQYQSALRGGAPNGVWLMGLGISLQAERRDADALDAFRKAKNSGTLSADLQAFVDSKIQQLAR